MVKLVTLAAVFGGALRVAHATPRRLRIVNGCDSEPMWIAHMAGPAIGPDDQDIKIEPLQYHDFTTSDGLSATRYWPKMRCNSKGGDCGLGESGGPDESCVKRDQGWDDYSQCAPPLDTKFEASFGINGEPCNPQTPGGVEMLGCDYIDISLVDGFSVPVKLEINGDCRDSTNDKLVEKIDCSELTLDHCPTGEELTAAGMTVDLQATNPKTKNVTGCYSPCMRLLDTKWVDQEERLAEDFAAAPYCCPTPPITPEACRAGPIIETQFIQVVRDKCPGAYSYAYDDSNGLLRCSSSSQYVVTYYCPWRAPKAVNGTTTAGEASEFLLP